MWPLPLELARGNINKEEDDNQNGEENTGVDDNVEEFHCIFEYFQRIGQDITIGTLCECSKKCFRTFLVGKSVIFKGICKGFVKGGRGDLFVIFIQLLDENGVKTVFFDREGKTAVSSLFVRDNNLFLTLGRGDRNLDFLGVTKSGENA